MNSPKVVTVGDHTVTVYPANGIMGIRRERILYEQSQIEDSDQDSHLLRIMRYPDMVSCADRIMPFEEFAVLPDAFLEEWKIATYELNPHWLDHQANEKKVTT